MFSAQANDSYAYERSICQDERKIKVIRAYYGRKKAFKCGFGLDTNCEAKGSEAKIKEACDGKNTCKLHASNDVFGNLVQRGLPSTFKSNTSVPKMKVIIAARHSKHFNKCQII
ncbi:L-rhamnose-binding lectin CSL3-like [Pocillopora verrucosa]|uniref:L-rhamnose-binding lectin CSL3-like n=1 Tax=Pocillopora verrucosa TaxID=203993 RepID=UPI003342C506